MSRNKKLGGMRRSQVLTYGPGAIIDFRAGNQGDGPVSVVAPGLEFWDEHAKPFSLTRQKISEPRLERKMRVQGFRLPPVDIDSENPQNQKKKDALPGFRFPKWLQCPSCYTIKLAKKWGGSGEAGEPSRWCKECSSARRRVHVVPARFVVACTKGHLDEFPWLYWLRVFSKNRNLCRGDRSCSLKLQGRGGTGLSSLYLTCKCGAERNMGDIFSKGILKGHPCQGHMPWLKENKEECGEELRVLHRGASNLYFPIEISALSIPPWSDAFQEALGVDWHRLVEEDDKDKLKVLVGALCKDAKDNFGMSEEDVYNEIVRRRDYLKTPEQEDLRHDELYSFTGESLFKYTRHRFGESDFKTTKQTVPKSLSKFVSCSIKVDRLREVRALKSFTRINQAISSFEEGESKFGKISSNTNIRWLPAIEVRGEGIFFSLDDSFLDGWCKQKGVTQRIKQIADACEEESDELLRATPKFILLHTLSHAIMRQISLECGYDTASIRERIYCNEGGKSNNGILLYTASSDAEGTLGGLARMSEEDKFLPLIKGAIAKASWCSSDPLCIKSIVSESEKYNLSACHNCTLVPETSCELFNRYLDRALLLGGHDIDFSGFFETLPED